MKNLNQFLTENRYPNDPNDLKDLHNIKMKLIGVGQKHHLDKIVNDPDWRVRAEVARRGFKEHLDKLVNDPDVIVRAEVADAGHPEHLDKLVNDPNENVRWVVATKTMDREHLKKLASDEDVGVGYRARMRLKHGLQE